MMSFFGGTYNIALNSLHHIDVSPLQISVAVTRERSVAIAPPSSRREEASPDLFRLEKERADGAIVAK